MLSFLILWLSVIFFCLKATYGCMPIGTINKVSTGQGTYVCLYISKIDWSTANNKTVTSGQFLKTVITPSSDELSKFNIKNSYTSDVYSNDTLMKSLNIENSFGNGIAVSVASMGVISKQKVYRYVDKVQKTSTYSSKQVLVLTRTKTVLTSINLRAITLYLGYNFSTADGNY